MSSYPSYHLMFLLFILIHLDVIPDEYLVVDDELVVLQHAVEAGVGPLDVPHEPAQLGQSGGGCGHVTCCPPIRAHLRSSARLSLVLRFMSSVTWMLLPRSRLAFRSTSSLSLNIMEVRVRSGRLVSRMSNCSTLN